MTKETDNIKDGMNILQRGIKRTFDIVRPCLDSFVHLPSSLSYIYYRNERAEVLCYSIRSESEKVASLSTSLNSAQ